MNRFSPKGPWKDSDFLDGARRGLGSLVQLVILAQGVVFAILLQVLLQGLLLLLDMPGHLTVDVREEELGVWLQFALGLLKDLHHL